MKRFCSIVLLSLLALFSNAGTDKLLDSLLAAEKKMQEGAARTAVSLRIIRCKLSSGDTAALSDLLRQVERSLNDHPDSLNLYHFHARKGDLLFTETAFSNDPGFEQYLSALSIAMALHSDSLLADAYFNIGYNYYLFGSYTIALRNLLQAKQYFHLLKNEYKVAHINRLCGIIQHTLGSSTLALQYYADARAYFEKTKNEKDLAAVFNNMGIVYTGMNDSLRAMEFLYKSLVIREKLNDKLGMGQVCNNIGNLMLLSGQPERALSYFKKGYELRKNNKGVYSGLTESVINIGKAYFNCKKINDARTSLEEGFAMAKKAGNLELERRAVETLREIYLLEGNYKKAYETQQVNYALKDSLYKHDYSEELIRISTAEVFEKKMLGDSLRTAEKEKRNAEMRAEKDKRDSFVRNGLIIGILMLLGIAFLLYKRNNEKREANKIIVAQRDELKNRQKEIIDSINYAKKIQESLLPTVKHIERTITRLKKDKD